MPVYSDEQRQQARVALDAAITAIRAAAPGKSQAPYLLGQAVQAALDIPEVLLILGFGSNRELLVAGVPELDPDELLRDAAVANLCSAAEVATYGWAKMVLAERLVTEEGLPRPQGDLGELQVPVPRAEGRPLKRRLADCSVEDLEAARAELERARRPAPRPKPPPPVVPAPAPSTPQPAPAPEAPFPWGRLVAAVLVVLALTLWLWRRNAPDSSAAPPLPLAAPVEVRAPPASPAPMVPPSAAIAPERRPARRERAQAPGPDAGEAPPDERAFRFPRVEPSANPSPQYDDPDLDPMIQRRDRALNPQEPSP